MPKTVSISTRDVDAEAVRALRVAAADRGLSLAAAIRLLLVGWAALYREDPVRALQLLDG